MLRSVFSPKALLVFLTLSASGASAQTVGELADLSRLSNVDPAAAITRIDAFLVAPQTTSPRQLFDLFLLKAEMLEQVGRATEAAPIYLQLAQFAARERIVLYQDPARFLRRATDIFVAAGQLREARAVLELLLEEQRDGGQSALVLAQTLDQLAVLAEAMGQDAEAQSYRTSAIAARDLNDNPPTRSADEEGAYREVEVFYATDRARTGDLDPSQFYGHGRGDLELGLATVTIPDSHQPGILEAPSIWRLEFGPNAAKHVVLQSVEVLEGDAFFQLFNDKLETAAAPDVFVFIHGYNVRFEQAAKRAAQMAHDLNFAGLPVLYSWPSRGSTMGYVPDTAVVQLSGRRLSRFLDDLIDRTGARKLHIVGHSMGNRALTEALELLALRRNIGPGDTPVFDQILFAAPDVDADLFSEMLSTIRPVARRLTLYASEQDWALATSRQLHGDAPRAGQGGADMLVNDKIDSVDMSELGDDMLAHSYFAQDSSALADMVALFWRNAAPNRRCGLEPLADAAQAASLWFYRPGRCQDNKLVEIISHMQLADVRNLDEAKRILNEKAEEPQVVEALTPIVSKLMAD